MALDDELSPLNRAYTLSAHEMTVSRLNIILGAAEIVDARVEFQDVADEVDHCACFKVLQVGGASAEVGFTEVELRAALHLIPRPDYSNIDVDDGLKSVEQILRAAYEVISDVEQQQFVSAVQIPAAIYQPYLREHAVHRLP